MEKTKTDQNREGRWVPCARLGGRFCLVALMEHFLAVSSYAASNSGPLIRNTSISVSGQYVRDLHPAYSTILDCFKGAAQLLELNPDEYGTHSGRRDGMTRAANVDVLDRLFTWSTAYGKVSGLRMATWVTRFRLASRLRLTLGFRSRLLSTSLSSLRQLFGDLPVSRLDFSCL